MLMSNLGATENIEVSSDGAGLVVETLFGGIRTLMLKSLMDSTETVLYREQPAFAPSWSADGRWIAFDAGGGNNADIWRISANGGPAKKIIENPGADWMPTYSPDGNYLCFLSNRSGQFELWIKNLVSGEISQITNSPAVKSRGFWSHDSKKLAYIQKPNRICIFDFASRKAEEFVYLPNWQSGNDTVHKLVWKEDDSSLYFFTFLAMQERWGNALIEISLENKRQRIVFRSQKEMTLSHMTFSIFKGDIYFLTHETMDDIWLAEGLQ
ncbi:MAG: hypothetical protein MUC94_15165 [bacterium]|nr:hypothetical protein [bacterium]